MKRPRISMRLMLCVFTLATLVVGATVQVNRWMGEAEIREAKNSWLSTQRENALNSRAQLESIKAQLSESEYEERSRELDAEYKRLNIDK